MKRAILALTAAASLVSSPAIAEICENSGIISTYEKVKDESSIFFLLRGKMDYLPDQQMPTVYPWKEGMERTVILTPVYASFEGEIFHEGGFEPFEAPIEMRLLCEETECGSYPSADEDALYFVSANESNMWFDALMTPCDDMHFDVREADALIGYLEETGVLQQAGDAGTEEPAAD